MIVAIPNRYKDTLDDFIDISDTKSLEWLDFLDRLEQIDKRSYNALRSKSSLMTLSNEDYLDNNVMVMLLKLMSLIRESKVHQCYDVVPFYFMSGRT